MNYKFQYNPEPGIVSDIIKMITIKFCSQSFWSTAYTLADSYMSDLKYIEDFSKPFSAKYSKILLFTYKIPHRPSVYLSSIFIDQLLSNYQNFSFDSFLSYFSDQSRIKKDLLSYYLGDQDYSQINVEPLIRKNTSIPDKIKILLLGFLLDPTTYIRHLTTQMQNYYTLLCEYHLSPATDFTLSDSFINSIIDSYCQDSEKVKSEIENSTINYSFCFTIPHYLYYNFSTLESWLIFTPTSFIPLNPISTPTTSQLLVEISHSLSDPKRITILHLLHSYGPMSIEELLDHLKCSRSALNHHLTVLTEVHLIKSFQQGRKNIYMYDSEGMKNTSDIFTKFSKGDF